MILGVAEWAVLLLSAFNVLLSLWLALDAWIDVHASMRLEGDAHKVWLRRGAARFFFRAEMLRLAVQIIFTGIGVSFVMLGALQTFPPGSLERIGSFAAGALLTAVSSVHAARFNLWLRRNV